MYLPKIWKPFDQLGRVVFVEFDVWEVHLEHGRTWVSHPKEHQFRFAQMHRSQCWRVHGSQRKHLLFSNKLFDFLWFVIFISFSKVIVYFIFIFYSLFFYLFFIFLFFLICSRTRTRTIEICSRNILSEFNRVIAIHTHKQSAQFMISYKKE